MLIKVSLVDYLFNYHIINYNPVRYFNPGILLFLAFFKVLKGCVLRKGAWVCGALKNLSQVHD